MLNLVFTDNWIIPVFPFFLFFWLNGRYHFKWLFLIFLLNKWINKLNKVTGIKKFGLFRLNIHSHMINQQRIWTLLEIWPTLARHIQERILPFLSRRVRRKKITRQPLPRVLSWWWWWWCWRWFHHFTTTFSDLGRARCMNISSQYM